MAIVTPFEWKSTARGRYLGDGYFIQKIGIPIFNEDTPQDRSEWIDLTGVIALSAIHVSTGTSPFDGTVQMYGFNITEKPEDSSSNSTGRVVIRYVDAGDYQFSTTDSTSDRNKLPKWAQWRITARTAGKVTVYISCLATTSQFAAGDGDRN